MWNDYEGHSKIHLANWHLVSMKKEYMGLGVPNLRDLNMALLGSWVKRFLKDEGKLWHSIIQQKYVRHGTNIFCLPHSQPFNFWNGVLWAAKSLKFGFRWSVGDGSKIRFWEDTWFGTAPLAVQFWDLYSICNQVGIPLAQVWDGVEVQLSFMRNFSGPMFHRWLELVEIVSSVRFNNDGML
jgi:hypothetical protein